MSLFPHLYVEKWNNEKKCYEEVHLYKRLGKWAREEDKVRGFEEVDFWPWNGTHGIFSLLGAGASPFDAICGIHNGEPPFVSSEIKEEIDSFFQEDSLYKAEDTVKWVTLTDLYIEKLKHPKVPDYNAEWKDDKKVYKNNPINDLIGRIETWIKLGTDEYWTLEDDRSLIRLVYWIVH